jgi:hypothetical protein
LGFFLGLLIVELSSLAVVYLPLSRANTPIDGHLDQEFPFRSDWWLPFASIALVLVFVLANVGLLVAVWRSVRELRASD